MSHQLHSSLVRILTADGMPVGVGFVASENLILTCAHVIEQASGSESTAHFDLPLLALEKNSPGVFWFKMMSRTSPALRSAISLKTQNLLL